MWPFKKPAPKCKHYKKSGEKALSNMETIIRFSEYKKEIDSIGYGILECSQCGVRSFSCMSLHFMPDNVSEKIDSFINYKINLDELIQLFEKNGYWYEKKINTSCWLCNGTGLYGGVDGNAFECIHPPDTRQYTKEGYLIMTKDGGEG